MSRFIRFINKEAMAANDKHTSQWQDKSIDTFAIFPPARNYCISVCTGIDLLVTRQLNDSAMVKSLICIFW